MIPVIITAGVIVAIVFNLLKVYIELAVPVSVTDKDGTIHPNALHDPTLRLAVILIGVLVGLASFALTGQAWTFHRAAQAVIDGAQIGLAAILAYHLVPGEFIPATPLVSGVVPLEPTELQPFTPPPQKIEITHVMAGQPPAPTPAPTPAPVLPPPAGDTTPTTPETPPAG